MSSIDSIAHLSTALSQAELRSAVSIKVFKMAQGQDQMVADLLTQTLDSVAQSMESLAPDAGAHLDTLA